MKPHPNASLEDKLEFRDTLNSLGKTVTLLGVLLTGLAAYSTTNVHESYNQEIRKQNKQTYVASKNTDYAVKTATGTTGIVLTISGLAAWRKSHTYKVEISENDA